MGCIHSIKVVQDSDAERYFMNLLSEVGAKPELLMCRLGEIFNRPYNEYIFSDGLYRQIEKQLWRIKAKEGLR